MASEYNRDGSALVTRNDGQSILVAAAPKPVMDAAIVAFMAADTAPNPLSGLDPALRALGQLLIQNGVITKAEAKAALATAGYDFP